ncbi:MAG: 16S rRNA (cytosine(1402)-N(4))-methyltransferase RsmH [Chloroflexi bacterium]|nr:16S rRNA (cytosine(1402)-N(4))-methyltransferase RsmH [Chloroflexota bacterium]
MLERELHTPVLTEEVIEGLVPRAGGSYIDCTLGAGGHAAAVLARILPGGRLLGIDADPEAIAAARERLSRFGDAVVLVNGNFAFLEDIARSNHFYPVDGILFDLGLSTMQLESRSRGFSFQKDAPLDMRFDPSQQLSADFIVNHAKGEELFDIIRSYGEEPAARKIARSIVAARPVTGTLDLAGVIERATGGVRGRIHPATRTFQALRIAVNAEIPNLQSALRQAISLLVSGGRLAVISYHSLEDRVVKIYLVREARGCLCPPEVLKCLCGHQPALRIVNRKVIRPRPEEVAANPRSRSARLRIAEKLAATGSPAGPGDPPVGQASGLSARSATVPVDPPVGQASLPVHSTPGGTSRLSSRSSVSACPPGNRRPSPIRRLS